MLKGEEIRGLADSLSISFDAVAKLLPAIANEFDEFASINQRMEQALQEIERYNPLTNDRWAYLLEVVEYGLGRRDTMPSADDFGLHEEFNDVETSKT